MPVTITGVAELVVVPFPSCPLPLYPQQYILPFSVSPQEKPTYPFPAVRSVFHFCPFPIYPQQYTCQLLMAHDFSPLAEMSCQFCFKSFTTVAVALQLPPLQYKSFVVSHFLFWFTEIICCEVPLRILSRQK
jgi:hypothetical protein